MATVNNSQKATGEDVEIMLGVLSAVERDSGLTQRSVSRELDIALGLANAYLKRCAKKGLIKVQQVPLNRYAYYLTPKGFAEKSRLTAEYLAFSFNFFRDSRKQCTELFEYCAQRGARTLALGGCGELAEIAILSATETPVRIVCVIDGDATGPRCANRPLVADLKAAQALAGGKIGAVVITDVRAPQKTYEAICQAAEGNGLAVRDVLAPGILRITGPAELGAPE